MALQIQIWVRTLVAALFADNTFAARSIDHSEFVDAKTVHVPNAAAAPGVEKNRKVLPAEMSTLEDVDLDYTIDEYTTDPVRIPNADTVELSYPKREAVIGASRSALAEKVYNELIYRWIPAGVKAIATTGAAVTAHLADATGNRKALNKATVRAAKTQFDRDNIPQVGRCMLLDADMYNQLMDDLSDSEKNAFNAAVDLSKGIIGHYLGFDFYMRSQVAKTTAAGVLKEFSAANTATDCAAALAWNATCVSRALGKTEMFDDKGNPLVYGDVLSFLIRVGGSSMRSDKKGVILIFQATEA